MSAIVRLEEVEFSYASGALQVGIPELEVERGGMLAVIGPNGSGKTTLLRLMSGLLRPHKGRVLICGVEPSSERRLLARRMALVSPQSALGFPYSVHEVVLMGRAPHVEGFRLETTKDLEAAHRAMELTDVARLSERTFDTLSSGERQRVAVARALAQEPELLLLDEPAAFLDVKQQTALYDLLQTLNETRGLTVVSVLHDLNLASLYFGRVAMLKAGGLYRIGSPEAVITYATVREVYETDVYVDLNDLTGSLNVLPLPARRRH